VNIVLRYLGVAINWAYLNHRIVANPLREMPFEKLKEDNRPFLVLEDVVPFLQQVDTIGNLHHRVAIRAMLLMGLRESEALRLRWDGFSGDDLFYAPARSKNGRAQMVPVAAEVRRIIASIPRDGEWVIPGRAESIHLKGYTRVVVQRAGAAIDIPHLTPHRLRASCATIVVGFGAGAHQVRDLLRHSSISTSQVYVQHVPLNIKALVDRSFSGIEQVFTPQTFITIPDSDQS
jgi:integrase